MSDPIHPPQPDTVIARRAWIVLALVGTAQMLTTFAGSALNVGFPRIEESLGVRQSVLAWSLSGYSIASASILLVAGRVGDRVGSRRVFLAGMAAFTVGSLAAGLAGHVGVLIAARVVQGFGSAMMVPSSLSLALREFPVPRRSIAVAVWGGMAAIAGASGPPVGAAFIEVLGWRSVFWALVPVGVVILAIGSRLLADPAATDPSAGRIDLLGSPLAAIAVGLAVAGLLQGQRWGWGDPWVVGAFVAAPVLMAVTVRRSATHPNPVLQLGLFRHRRFVVASMLTTIYNMATTGYWLAAPLFLQQVWGWSVLESGLAIVGGPLAHLVTAKRMGGLADRGRHRMLMIAGTSLTAVALCGLAWSVGDTPNFWTAVFPWTLLVGVSGSMAWPTFTSAALLDIADEDYGAANGVNLTMRGFGGALGVAVVIALLGDDATTAADFRTAWLLSAVGLFACALALAALYPRPERSGGRRHP